MRDGASKRNSWVIETEAKSERCAAFRSIKEEEKLSKGNSISKHGFGTDTIEIPQ